MVVLACCCGGVPPARSFLTGGFTYGSGEKGGLMGGACMLLLNESDYTCIQRTDYSRSSSLRRFWCRRVRVQQSSALGGR